MGVLVSICLLSRENGTWNLPETPQFIEDAIARLSELDKKKNQLLLEGKKTGKTDIIENAKINIEQAILDIFIFQRRLEELQDKAHDKNILEEQAALHKMIRNAEQMKESEMRLIATFSEVGEQSYQNKENRSLNANKPTQQPEDKALLQKKKMEEYLKLFLKDSWNDLLGKTIKEVLYVQILVRHCRAKGSKT